MHKILLISLLLAAISARSDCTNLVQIVETARINGGIVFPLDREHIIKLTQAKILPPEARDMNNEFFVEDRNKPFVRVFHMKEHCADLQWMISRDFLALLGIRIASD